MTTGNTNQKWARTAMDELVRCGVSMVCLAPGSRSTALVLAAAEHPGLRVVTHLDERCAAFFALGVGKTTRLPAAVITTSGTAVANLFPAVVEASQAGVPLLLLTADRPHRLRDADANQAIDQLKLFGPYVRRFVDLAPPTDDEASLRHLRSVAARAVLDAAGSDPGPVHLNFPFAKPLEPLADQPDDDREGAWGRPDGASYTATAVGEKLPSDADVASVVELISQSERGVIVAGPTPEPWRTGRWACALSAATGLPLMADPLSGGRYCEKPTGATVLGAYDLLLKAARRSANVRPPTW